MDSSTKLALGEEETRCRSDDRRSLGRGQGNGEGLGSLAGWLWLGWREFAGNDRIAESGSFVGAIAEGLVGGMAAAAERNGSAARQTKWRSLRIYDFKIALHANGSVGVDGNFGGCHFSLLIEPRENTAGKPGCRTPNDCPIIREPSERGNGTGKQGREEAETERSLRWCGLLSVPEIPALVLGN